MKDFNAELEKQIIDAISIQRRLLKNLENGTIPTDSEKITIDICAKIINNAIAINKFNEVVNIDIDNEIYENYLKTLDSKDINIFLN